MNITERVIEIDAQASKYKLVPLKTIIFNEIQTQLESQTSSSKEQSEKRGSLQILITRLDPFIDKSTLENIINNLQDQHVLSSLGIGQYNFYEILLYLPQQFANIINLAVPIKIADENTLKRIRNGYYIKQKYLQEYNKRYATR